MNYLEELTKIEKEIESKNLEKAKLEERMSSLEKKESELYKELFSSEVMEKLSCEVYSPLSSSYTCNGLQVTSIKCGGELCALRCEELELLKKVGQSSARV